MLPRLHRKSFSTPDQVRTFGHGHMDVIALDETMVARAHFEPGWRWSIDVKPLVRTSACQVRHLGVCLTGRMHVVGDDGSESRTRPPGASRANPGSARRRRQRQRER